MNDDLEGENEVGSSRCRGRLFFLDKPGGKGRKFTIEAIQNDMKMREKKVIPD